MEQADVKESEEDFAAACRHSLAHGNLLSLRYLVPDIPWQICKASPARVRQMQAWISRVLSLLLRAAETAQHPLSTPQETMNSAHTKPSMRGFVVCYIPSQRVCKQALVVTLPWLSVLCACQAMQVYNK